MKRWVRENIPVIIVFGIIIWFGVSNLMGKIKTNEHYLYNNDEATEFLNNSNYGIKVLNYGGYKLESVLQNRRKYNKDDYGRIDVNYVNYVNGHAYFTYSSGKIREGYKDEYPGTYRVQMGEKTKEIPYEKMQLKNTTLYYIDSSKYDIFKDGFNIDGNSYLWIIDDICYSTDWIQYNIEHEEVIKLIESME